MIRITELSLPLDYTLKRCAGDPEAAVDSPTSICSTSRCSSAATTRARRTAASCSSASSIVTVRDEAAVLQRLRWRPARAPLRRIPTITRWHGAEQSEERPLIVGFGPCGLFAALLLAQMGFKPIVLERGRDVRRRTADTWALWRRKTLTPESNVQFGEGGAGPVFRRQAVQPDQGPEVLRPQGDARVRARRRAAGDPLREQAAHRHLSPHRRGGEDARGDHRAGRRSALREQGRPIC